MRSRPIHAAALLLCVLAAPGVAHAQGFDKAKDAFREAIKRQKADERIAGIRALVEAGDVRAVDDLVAAVRAHEKAVEKKREEIEQLGKENTKIWKPLDDYVEQQKDQGVAEPKVPAEIVNRVVPKAQALQEKLKLVNDELVLAEATRAALMEGVGRLLTAADPAARAPKILELASAAAKATSFDDKASYIRVFGTVRAPESRDALIEMARLSQEGQVRTAAVVTLGRLADPTAIPTLSEALKDEVWSVKTAAAQALAATPSIDGVPALAQALGSNEGGTADAIVKALEDLTGVTYFDNGTLWTEWFQKEGQDLKAALDDLDSGEPSIRMAAMNTLAAKGTVAGARKMLAQEGLDPARDSRVPFRISKLGIPPGRAAADDEVQARRSAMGRTLAARPKPIRDRAIASLFLEPLTHARQLRDFELAAAYLRAASRVKDAAVVDAMSDIVAPKEKAGGSKVLMQPGDAEGAERARRAAIEALGWQDHDNAVVALVKVLRDDRASKETKEVAVASLGRLRREACVLPLIDALLERGTVAEAAAKALKELTGADHGVDRQAWHTWWNETGKETAKLARKSEQDPKDDETKGGEAGRGTSFYGITTRSKRLIYVLDVSGSMLLEDRTGSTGGPGGSKIDRAKRELKASITALPEDAHFTIIVYADGLRLWKQKLTPGDKGTKGEALKWVDELRAIGATNVFDALEKAFELAGRGATDKRYNLAADTILFMSDGHPNRGRIVDPRAIIAEISRMNEHKKVTIHTIGVGDDHDVELMKRIARMNGGTYVAR
jgi:HEAT repeat protein